MLSYLWTRVDSVDHWLDAIGAPLAQRRMAGFPWKISATVIVYLIFVLKVGPTVMKKRQPFNIDNLMRLYNLVNVIGCAYVLAMSLKLTRYSTRCWQCIEVEDIDDPHWLLDSVSMGYLYLKLFDLLDTVFFVLRKNFRQVSPLHVVHHATMPLVVAFAYKMSQNLFGSQVVVLNCFVHVIMYTYYFLSSYPHLQKYLWWKKYITVLQLMQFTILLVHSAYFILFVTCPGVSFGPYLTLVQGTYFTYAFCRFYIDSYKKGKGQKDN
ncbi:Elongation of very long chain fatty acids protein 1 [Halotydeus destructor]|nr:Elongation of very long chain fatty acids protein 1 [Halotydeus destructor]